MKAIYLTEQHSGTRAPDAKLRGWNESPEYVCRTCKTLARINPENPQQMGCGECGFIADHGSSIFFKKVSV